MNYDYTFNPDSDSSSESSDDDEVLLLLAYYMLRFRKETLFRRRWDRNYLIPLAVAENSFISEYRMDPASFGILSTMLQEGNLLPMDELMGNRASPSGAVSVESKLGAALIILGGGRVIEAMRTHGLAKSTTYENLKNVVRAVNAHPALEIKCCNNEQSLGDRAAAFNSRSSHGLFKYVTGAIDGLVIGVSPRNVVNQTMFYSGGKKKFGINVQAVCDADCVFIGLTAMHVGSTNDCQAFTSSYLKDLCDSQSFPFHWLGDAAYPLMATLMSPYIGSLLNWDLDSLNFHLSQLRITIERAFGILIQRWGIFWKKLKFNIPFCCEIIHACCRLHNFCIKRGLPIVQRTGVPIPHLAEVDADGVLLNDDWRTVHRNGPIDTVSVVRTRILEEIRGRNYWRPERRL